MKITAVILAGGLATRMGDKCRETPKSMLQFAGYPFLQYLVSWFVRLEIKEIIISTAFLSHKIESYFGTYFWQTKGVRIIKEDEPLGTGGATKYACEKSTNEDVLLCNGDTIVSLDIPQLFKIQSKLLVPIKTVLMLNKDVPNQGAISVKNGIVIEFNEGEEIREPINGKDYFRGSSTGYYFLKRSSILEHFPDGKSSLERDVLPVLVQKKLVGAVNSGFCCFLDYGIPERCDFLSNNSEILTKLYGKPFTGNSDYE